MTKPTENKGDMRDAVRVRMTKEQYLSLRNILSLSYNLTVLLEDKYKPVSEFMKAAGDDFSDGPGDLIGRAREDYKDNDEDVEVDDDAPLSRTDDGVWVGGWLWVPNEQD